MDCSGERERERVMQFFVPRCDGVAYKRNIEIF